MKTLIMFFISALFPLAIPAQKITWNQTCRLKESQNLLFLGQKDRNVYFLLNNRLIQYSDDGNKIVKIKLRGMYGVVSKAFIIDDEIILFCKEKSKGFFHMFTRITVHCYDFQGNFKREATLLNAPDNQLNVLANSIFDGCREGPDANARVEMSISENHKYFGLHHVSNTSALNRKDEFWVFNSWDFRMKYGMNLKTEDKLQCFALNDGGCLMLKGDHIRFEDSPNISEPITLFRYDATGNIKRELSIPLKPEQGEFRNGLFYKLDEQNNALYVLSNFATYAPKECNIDVRRHETCVIQLEKISLDSLTPGLSKSIRIQENTIKKAGSISLLTEPKGLAHLGVMDVKVKDDAIFIFAQLKYDVTKSNIFDNDSAEVKFAHQIIFRESVTNGASFQFVNKTAYQLEYPEYGTIFYKNDLYVIYQERKWKTRMNVIRLGEKLEEKNRIRISVRRFRDKVLLNPYQFYKQNDNKYTLFGRHKSRVGTALLEFE